VRPPLGLLVAGLILAGCGAAPPALTVASAFSIDTRAGTQPFASLVLSSAPAACDAFEADASTVPRGTSEIVIRLYATNDAGNFIGVGPGDYDVVASGDNVPLLFATAVLYEAAADCTFSTSLADSGQVHVSSVGADGISGHVDLTFPAGEHQVGDFSAPACAPTGNGGGADLHCG
jgi:hypothetical protein